MVSLTRAVSRESFSIACETVMPPSSSTPLIMESSSYWAFTMAASRDKALRWVSVGMVGSEAPMPIASMYPLRSGFWSMTSPTRPLWTRLTTPLQPVMPIAARTAAVVHPMLLMASSRRGLRAMGIA